VPAHVMDPVSDVGDHSVDVEDGQHRIDTSRFCAPDRRLGPDRAWPVRHAILMPPSGYRPTIGDSAVP
jgi:hypothetical protein